MDSFNFEGPIPETLTGLFGLEVLDLSDNDFSVYLGTKWQGYSDWSDKKFNWGNHDRFGTELEVLGNLNNANVLTPLAYVLYADKAYLFYE
ncbi:hypothetical protein G4B88_009594 [Cannabis sativa]|uniref:Uncharacterized protein n=1 Tax=Cannabis sativa TaxID=3483 RepID=A0A7J6GE74_CANSA|nr:hypothetical protein G4B88_009594 [Cannabis sativa]